MLERLKKHPAAVHAYLDLKNAANRLRYGDRAYLRKQYRKTHGVYPDLEHPQAYSEKLVWSMLNHRDDRYIALADKWRVREYVREKIGERYLVPSPGMFHSAGEIDFDRLPEAFVLKATHGSGWNFLCPDKSRLDRRRALSEVRYWLARSYYKAHREWPYRYMHPGVICEAFIGTADGTPPLDYKIFCFDGQPKLIQLDIGRFSAHRRNVYDTEWTRIAGVEIAHPQDFSREYPRPGNLEEMLGIARTLSAGFPHVRIDLYDVDGSIYLGEMTFFHGAGVFEYFRPDDFHLRVGGWFRLPPRNIDTWQPAAQE